MMYVEHHSFLWSILIVYLYSVIVKIRETSGISGKLEELFFLNFSKPWCSNRECPESLHVFNTWCRSVWYTCNISCTGFKLMPPVFFFCLICVCMTDLLCVMSSYVCVCVCTCLSAPCSSTLRSSYKDCNTLHLPMERFSPVRRFSDGAATIQAFKAQLEHSSLIKQLKQVCPYCWIQNCWIYTKYIWYVQHYPHSCTRLDDSLREMNLDHLAVK